MSQTNQKISIVFVEELTLYREGLTSLYGSHPDFDLLGSACSGMALVELLIRRSPDLGLVDLHLTDIHAFEVVRRARTAGVPTC